MCVWCLHPFVLGRGSLCSYHRGRGGQVIGKLNSEGEVSWLRTHGFMQGQGDSCSPISSDSPASSPDLVFQVVKGPEPQRPSLKGETQPQQAPATPNFLGFVPDAL